MRGIVRHYEGDWQRDGRLLWQRENLIVTAGLTALASLLGGTTTGEFLSVVGFGSGNTPPTLGDTGLTTTPTYYNAAGAVTIGPSGGVAAGSVQIGYSLGTTDYAANPLTIQEMGFFGNVGALSFPAAVGTANANWTNGHAYVIGNLIVDSNGNVQRCTTAGTSGGAHPAWSTTIGLTTNDSAPLVWTLVALHTAPTPLIGHLVVPSFPFTLTGTFSGTYTVSM